MNGTTLDTDLGTDVDDLLAVATLMGEGLELDALTTVYGDTALRARIAHAVYGMAARAAPPIAAGLGDPWSGRGVFWAGHEGRHLDPAQRARKLDELDAVGLLAASRTVIAIGPLTNVAAALERPGARIERVVAMGGDFAGRPEHNIICDVDAAAAVFDSGVPMSVVGTEQTTRIRLSDDFLAAMPPTPLGAHIRSEVSTFRSFMGDHANSPNDSLAVLMVTRPELFEMRSGRIVVDRDPDRAGHVRLDPASSGPHRVVVDFDVPVVSRLIVDLIAEGAAFIA